ncbi:hypothetical protein B0J18DRAFT_289760 [Chaetomium sp. MPI-SDFR-AT-0129]|nr:hypothetical protein B0J18DRAFT_289760 [Chaetomium sp. MPI-SDFR-AT-0129]
MSWLRPSLPLLGPGARCLFLRTPMVYAAERIPAVAVSQIPTATRSFSSQRAGHKPGNPPRFQPSEASRARTPNTMGDHPGEEYPDGFRPRPQPARKPIDTNSKEYKRAARRYMRFVVGMPFFIVLSYHIYNQIDEDGRLPPLFPREPPGPPQPEWNK